MDEGTASYDFTLEASQRERTLYDGQTLLGFLQPFESTRYELYIESDSYLEIRPLVQNAENLGSCLRVND